jgi:hypothetical protein
LINASTFQRGKHFKAESGGLSRGDDVGNSHTIFKDD